MKVLEELKENVENAGPLFQLLLKCHLERPDVSMAVIQVLEGFLTDKNAPTESSPIGIQLRAAFLSEFLEKQILVDRNAQIPSCKLCSGLAKLFKLTCFVRFKKQNLPIYSNCVCHRNCSWKLAWCGFQFDLSDRKFPSRSRVVLEVVFNVDGRDCFPASSAEN